MRIVTLCHFMTLLFSLVAFGQTKTPGTPTGKRTYAYPSKKKMALKRKLKAQGFEETVIPEYNIPPLLTREDLNKIVPKDVTPQSSNDEVLRKMSDKAVQVWLKSPTMQSFAVVQTAQEVEKAMKAEVALGEPQENGVKHKLNFQVQAFQTTSRVDYSGYVSASLIYNLRDNKTGVELREKVFKNKDLYVNHSVTHRENLSSVGMKWSF